MHQREFLMSVRVGDTVYINTRSKRYCGRSGVVTEKEHRRAKVRLNDHIEQWFSFYTLDRSPIEVKVVPDNSKDFTDTLTINYEEFPEEGCAVLTVSRNGEALHMFRDDNAFVTYHLLCGTLEEAIKAIREENEEIEE